MRELMALVLNDNGYRTVQAIHGAHALQVMDKERRDLVVSDVMMPVLSAAELCRVKAEIRPSNQPSDPDELRRKQIGARRGR